MVNKKNNERLSNVRIYDGLCVMCGKLLKEHESQMCTECQIWLRHEKRLDEQENDFVLTDDHCYDCGAFVGTCVACSKKRYHRCSAGESLRNYCECACGCP